MWQEISESSSSRMVHFISWLSDLMLELRKWIIFMVLLPLGTQWQEANMHHGPGKRAGGSGPARRSPARTHTLPWTPGRGSAPGQRRQPVPAATHAERPGRGRRVPPSPRSPPCAASPPPRPLLSPPPPLASAPAPPSARARWPKMPGAGDPRRAREALTPTREEPRQEKAESGLARWPGRPGSGLLRCRRRLCVRLGPAASSLSGRDHSGS